MAKTRRASKNKRSKRGGMFGPIRTAKRMLSSARASAAPYSSAPNFIDRAYNEWHSELMAAMGNPEAEEKMRAKGAQMLESLLNNSPGLKAMVQEGMAMESLLTAKPFVHVALE